MLSFRQWQSELCACCSSGGDGCLAIRSYRREPDLRLRISVRWSSSGELPGWPVAMGGEWRCIAVWNQRKNVKSSRQVSDLEEFWIQILEWYSSDADFREWMKKKKSSENCLLPNDRISSASPTGMDLFSLKQCPPPTHSVPIPNLPVQSLSAAAASWRSFKFFWQLLLLLSSCLSSDLIYP